MTASILQMLSTVFLAIFRPFSPFLHCRLYNINRLYYQVHEIKYDGKPCYPFPVPPFSSCTFNHGSWDQLSRIHILRIRAIVQLPRRHLHVRDSRHRQHRYLPLDLRLRPHCRLRLLRTWRAYSLLSSRREIHWWNLRLYSGIEQIIQGLTTIRPWISVD